MTQPTPTSTPDSAGRAEIATAAAINAGLPLQWGSRLTGDTRDEIEADATSLANVLRKDGVDVDRARDAYAVAASRNLPLTASSLLRGSTPRELAASADDLAQRAAAQGITFNVGGLAALNADQLHADMAAADARLTADQHGGDFDARHGAVTDSLAAKSRMVSYNSAVADHNGLVPGDAGYSPQAGIAALRDGEGRSVGQDGFDAQQAAEIALGFIAGLRDVGLTTATAGTLPPGAVVPGPPRAPGAGLPDPPPGPSYVPPPSLSDAIATAESRGDWLTAGRLKQQMLINMEKAR